MTGPRNVLLLVPDLFFVARITTTAAHLVRALKAEPDLAAVRVVGFYSHVDAALREAALAAGVDAALPRSAFTTRLPGLLAGED